MDGWPPVKVKRFRGECPSAYEIRSEQIRKIVDGFRHGQYSGQLADEMDDRLIQLQQTKRYEERVHSAATN